VNYPDILPQGDLPPSGCSGIRDEDIAYARQKLQDINNQIGAAVSESQATNPDLDLVDLEEAFDGNGLCGDLAVDLNVANIGPEVERLLDLEGVPNGNSRARFLMDNVVSEYRLWRLCGFVLCSGDTFFQALKAL